MKPETIVDGERRLSTAGNLQRLAVPKKPHLSVEFEHSGGATILHCRGRIDFRSAIRGFSTIVAEVLPSVGGMVVNLAGVESIDSGALSELVMTHMWAEAAGYTLLLAGLTKSVRQLFEETNVDSVFDVYGTVPQAIAALGRKLTHSA